MRCNLISFLLGIFPFPFPFPKGKRGGGGSGGGSDARGEGGWFFENELPFFKIWPLAFFFSLFVPLPGGASSFLPWLLVGIWTPPMSRADRPHPNIERDWIGYLVHFQHWYM